MSNEVIYHGGRMAFFKPMTILTKANIPDAVSVGILMVVNQVKEIMISVLCNSILLIIPAAKPEPHSTKEHCTSRR